MADLGRSRVSAPSLWTIGHSNHPFEHFLHLLRSHRIDVLIDVRTAPRSRHAPHFGKNVLSAALAESGIAYVFLGRELGGRPADPKLYDAQGNVQYAALAKSPLFLEGIERLERELGSTPDRRCAIMCSEENPAACHRHLLVARVLRRRRRDIEILNIRGDARVEPFDLIEDRVAASDGGAGTLFDEEAGGA